MHEPLRESSAGKLDMKSVLLSTQRHWSKQNISKSERMQRNSSPTFSGWEKAQTTREVVELFLASVFGSDVSTPWWWSSLFSFVHSRLSKKQRTFVRQLAQLCSSSRLPWQRKTKIATEHYCISHNAKYYREQCKIASAKLFDAFTIKMATEVHGMNPFEQQDIWCNCHFRYSKLNLLAMSHTLRWVVKVVQWNQWSLYFLFVLIKWKQLGGQSAPVELAPPLGSLEPLLEWNEYYHNS